MAPMTTSGPYYAIILAPGTLDTKGGPVTDALGRVVDVKDEVIPGLYAAGNCARPRSPDRPIGAPAVRSVRPSLSAISPERTPRRGPDPTLADRRTATLP